MKVYNHELTVMRNESFTIDKTLENKDGSPFILSNQLQNPHFLITVASSLYEQSNRYVFKKWLPITTPRFYTTVPVNLSDFKNLDKTLSYPNGFKNIVGLPSGYVNDVWVSYTDNDDALFYWEDEEGNREYKYFNGEKYVDYTLRLVCLFPHWVTKDWLEKNYFYNIDLVTGVLNSDGTFSVIDAVYPILEATKINVLSNLKGGM